MFSDSAQGRESMQDIGQSVTHEILKATPPAGAAAWLWMGHSLPEWVSLLTIIYLAGLIAQQGYKLFRWLRSH